MMGRKNNYFILTNIQLLLIALILAIDVSYGLAQTPIDSKRIKEDILKNQDIIIPEDVIEEIEISESFFIYFDEYAIVHLPYRDYLGEAFMKPSIIAIYQMESGKWNLKNVIPYYYNIKLIEGTNGYFYSDNLFCNPNGDCQSYHVISQLENYDMVDLFSISGYDRYNYYDRLFILDKISELESAIGDTIVKSVELHDFEINNGELKSAILSIEFQELIGIDDPLKITKGESSKPINID